MERLALAQGIHMPRRITVSVVVSLEGDLRFLEHGTL